MSALLVVERNLHYEFGHAPSQIRAIAEYSAADQIIVVTWRKTETLPLSSLPDTRPERLSLHPVLCAEDEARSHADPAGLALSEASTLRTILGNGGRVVIPSATEADLRMAMALAQDGSLQVQVRILMLSSVADLSETERDHLRTMLQADHIRLSTETENLASAVRTQYGLPCRADFVLPCTVLPGDSVANQPQGNGFRVGMLGRPRPEKGCYRLHGILRALAAQSRSMAQPAHVTMVVQICNKLRSRNLMMVAPVVYARVTSRNPTTEILWGALRPQDYREVLFGLDAVLLPYELDRYATSGSGVIIDAIHAGVPVIHTRGMAMQELLSSGNALDAVTDDEFASAILHMASDPVPFRAAAAQAREDMLGRIACLPLG